MTPSELWAQEFAGCPLGDVRRNRRAAQVTEALSVGGGGSVSQAMGSWAALKGCSRLLNHPAVEHPALLAGHVEQTIARARAYPVVLSIQDTTTCSFGQRQPIEGLGPIDSGLKTQGFLTHSNLLVEPQHGAVLGVAHQQVWARAWTAHPKEETASQRKKRPRESEQWSKGQIGLATAMGRQPDASGSWSAAPDGAPTVLAVFDREGDVFEALETLHQLGHGYVIRATRNRAVEDHEGLSLDLVEQAPVLGERPFDVPRKPNQAPRQTTLTFRATTVALRPPRNRNRRGQPLAVSLVLVQEETKPAQGERLCWYLLTSLPVTTLEQAAEVARLYRWRWRIEDFHMGLKTGCGLEHAQLETFHAFQNLLALTSIATWQLLALRDAARAEAPAPPSDTVSELQLQILKHRFPKLEDSCTARDVLRAIAMLGGFLGRKSDGDPGWRTLWWGLQKLQLMEQGARLLRS